MTENSIAELCRKIALGMDLNPDLAVAICEQESNYIANAVRYEPNWDYILEVEKYSKLLGITYQTEYQMQKFSWGAMQVMGTVARELGFKGYLTDLLIPQYGLLYGCTKLKKLVLKYSSLEDAIASYNAGSPVKIKGVYKNQAYVSMVLKRIQKLKRVQ